MVNEIVYASDLIEEAQNLAQVKAWNSFSFREMLRLLNEVYGYVYEQIALIDQGYWTKTVRLTQQLTHIPPHVKNTVHVYSAQEIVGFDRRMFRQSGNRNLNSPNTYYISGMDLWCPDATRRTVWCEYVPEPPLLTFTKNNRDPKLIPAGTIGLPAIEEQQRYGLYRIDLALDVDPSGVVETNAITVTATHLTYTNMDPIDLTALFAWENHNIVYFKCDFPYVFVSYVDTITNDYSCFIYKDLIQGVSKTEFNPFDYLGRPTSLRYLTSKYNDYTGMGCLVRDYLDLTPEGGPIDKELGWTPDTIVTYPSPIVRTYIVARLAQRIADRNSSNIMEIERVLADASRSLGSFLKRNQGSFSRIDNVTGMTISDFL